MLDSGPRGSWGSGVEIRVLGPVEVWVGDRAVAVGRPQQRLLLAALTVDAGRAVPVDSLMDRVWDRTPADARRTLHVLVTRLRRVLREAAESDDVVRVARRGGGYALEVEPDGVDLLRFQRMSTEARE